MTRPGVLIVANPYESMRIARVVEEQGLRPIVAESGEGVLALYQLERPALVVLASGLLAVPADEILARLRAEPEAAPHIIAIVDAAGDAADADLAAFAFADADARLTRPIDLAALRALLPRYAEPEVGASHTEWEETPTAVDRMALRRLTRRTPGVAVTPPLERPSSAPPPPAAAPAVARLVDALPGLEADLGLQPSPERALVARSAQTTRRDRRAKVVAPPGLPPRGELGKAGICDLVVQLHKLRFVGRLDVRSDAGERSLFFENGRPLLARSTAPQDQLPDMLQRAGRISRDQKVRAYALVYASGRPFIDVLTELGALPAEAVAEVQRTHAEELVDACFLDERGEWALSSEVPPDGQRVATEVHPFAIVARAIRRHFTVARLGDLVGRGDTIVDPTPQLGQLAELADLPEREMEAVRILERGPRAVTMLAALPRLDEQALLALVHALVVIGGATVRRSEVENRLENRLAAKYAQSLDGDYFALLEVPADATGEQIRGAFRALRSEFDPARWGAERAAEAGHRLAEIGELLDEALLVLADDARRAAYRSALAEP